MRRSKHLPLAGAIPILHDCPQPELRMFKCAIAAPSALAGEADSRGDWATVLFTLAAQFAILAPSERTVSSQTSLGCVHNRPLAQDELVQRVEVKIPPKGRRRVPGVQASRAGVSDGSARGSTDNRTAMSVRMRAIALGCVGLTPIKLGDGRMNCSAWQPAYPRTGRERCGGGSRRWPIHKSDMRGSADYKRTLVGALVKRAMNIAVRRARGEQVSAGPHLCLTSFMP